ncbi:hypothetical protein TWF694_005324 [Orbilia ellipsospora]|uniref:F-box domain-containing protein n=1 Tax=Orbilia ellipsospora TaxID=2528407 RepID=A0AAV9WST9_9PEZI
MSSSIHILSLPIEIQTSILSHLTFPAIVTASLTCQKWHHIIKTTKHLTLRTYDADGIYHILRTRFNTLFNFQNNTLQVFTRQFQPTEPFVDVSRSPSLDEGVLTPGYGWSGGSVVSKFFSKDFSGGEKKQHYEGTQIVSVRTVVKNAAEALLMDKIKHSKARGHLAEEEEMRRNTEVRMYCLDVYKDYEDDLILIWDVTCVTKDTKA